MTLEESIEKGMEENTNADKPNTSDALCSTCGDLLEKDDTDVCKECALVVEETMDVDVEDEEDEDEVEDADDEDDEDEDEEDDEDLIEEDEED